MNNLKMGSLKLNKPIREIFAERLRRGQSMRMNIKGRCMYPFIKRSDIIIVKPIKFDDTRVGDIVVYTRDLEHDFTVHRLIGKRRDAQGREFLFTKGDASQYGDFPVYPDNIYGKVTIIERKDGRIINLETKLNRLSSYLIAYLSWTLAILKEAIISPPQFLKRVQNYFSRGRLFREKRNIEDEYLVSLVAEGFSLRNANPKGFGYRDYSGRESGNQNGFDWEYILDKARRNGVSPILYFRLKNQKDNFPKTFLKKLEKDYYQRLRRNMLMWEEIKPILASFKEDEIKVILLKGVALAELVYKNLALRPMYDIDLLVKKEDLPRIDEKMRDFGYSTGENYRNSLRYSSVDYLNSIEYRNKVVPIHFHWHLVNSTLPTFMYASKIDMERIWKEAIPVKISGTKAFSLAPHHLLIHLSEHASKPGHSLSRLIFLCDIAETIKVYQKELNWELLINEARMFNLDRPLYYSLEITSRLIGLDSIPGDILGKLMPKNLGYWERRFIARLETVPTGRQNRNSHGLSYLLHLAMCQGNFQKIRFIYQSFFPPSAVLRLRYPSQRNRLGFHLKRRLNQSLSIFHSI